MNTPAQTAARWPSDEPPLRSLLFVPGGKADMLAKAPAAGADAVVMDLEDSVPDRGKAEARPLVTGALEANWSRCPLAVVRINAAASRHLRADLQAAVRGRIGAIMLPKCETPTEVSAIARQIGRLEKARRLKAGSVKIFLLVETPRCLLQLERIVQATLRVSLLALGAEDLSLRTGISRSTDDRELLYARSSVTTVAAAYGCLAIDSVHMKYRDQEGLAAEALQARRLGFSGKLVVHPDQIETVHRAFAPSPEELNWAREILKVAGEMDALGAGAAGWKGELVDRPVIERAKRILAAARNEGL